MTSFDRMATQLRATGLYRMDDKSFISAEMRAYGAEFDYIYESLAHMLYSCFIDHTDARYFSSHQWLFGMPTTEGQTEAGKNTRKYQAEMMKKRLAIRNNDFNLKGIQSVLESGGLSTTITEDAVNKKIVVRVTEDKGLIATEKEKITFIKNYLPCHSTAEIIFV